MQAVGGGILVLSGNGGGTFSNSGTLRATTGGSVQVTGALTSSGTVDIGTDTLSVTGSGTYTQNAGTFRLAGGSVTSSTALVFNGGLVDARGTINSAITNGANLQPALGGSGLTVNGAVTLLSSSKLTFQLGGLTQGSQYGFVNANGSVALNGNLVVSFVNGFQATNNNNFTVLSSTALSGAFTNVASGNRIVTSDNAGTFLVTYNGTNVVLSNFIPGVLAPSSPETSAPTGKVVGPQPAGPKPKPQNPAIVANVPAVAPQTANPSKPTAAAPQPARGSAAARGKGRPTAIRLENSDQLLGLMEGSEATTAKGKVTVRLPKPSRPTTGPALVKQPNGIPNPPTVGKPPVARPHPVTRPIAGRQSD